MYNNSVPVRLFHASFVPNKKKKKKREIINGTVYKNIKSRYSRVQTVERTVLLNRLQQQ